MQPYWVTPSLAPFPHLVQIVPRTCSIPRELHCVKPRMPLQGIHVNQGLTTRLKQDTRWTRILLNLVLVLVSCGGDQTRFLWTRFKILVNNEYRNKILVNIHFCYNIGTRILLNLVQEQDLSCSVKIVFYNLVLVLNLVSCSCSSEQEQDLNKPC